jgi:hypothetical protein
VTASRRFALVLTRHISGARCAPAFHSEWSRSSDPIVRWKSTDAGTGNRVTFSLWTTLMR